jgi:hypothetical protein
LRGTWSWTWFWTWCPFGWLGKAGIIELVHKAGLVRFGFVVLQGHANVAMPGAPLDLRQRQAQIEQVGYERVPEGVKAPLACLNKRLTTAMLVQAIKVL